MTEEERRKRGRPVGTGKAVTYGTSRSIRFTPDHIAAIRELAAHWKTSESEAVRRAVLEMVKRARRMKP